MRWTAEARARAAEAAREGWRNRTHKHLDLDLPPLVRSDVLVTFRDRDGSSREVVLDALPPVFVRLEHPVPHQLGKPWLRRVWTLQAGDPPVYVEGQSSIFDPSKRKNKGSSEAFDSA